MHFSSPQHLLHSCFSTSSAAINQRYLLLSTPWAASQGERQALPPVMPCVLSNAKTEVNIQSKPVLFFQLLRGRTLSKSYQLHHPPRLSVPCRLQLPVPALSCLHKQKRTDSVSVEQCFCFYWSNVSVFTVGKKI